MAKKSIPKSPRGGDRLPRAITGDRQLIILATELEDNVDTAIRKASAIAELMGSPDPKETFTDDCASFAAWTIRDLLGEALRDVKTLTSLVLQNREAEAAQ